MKKFLINFLKYDYNKDDNKFLIFLLYFLGILTIIQLPFYYWSVSNEGSSGIGGPLILISLPAIALFFLGGYLLLGSFVKAAIKKKDNKSAIFFLMAILLLNFISFTVYIDAKEKKAIKEQRINEIENKREEQGKIIQEVLNTHSLEDKRMRIIHQTKNYARGSFSFNVSSVGWYASKKDGFWVVDKAMQGSLQCWNEIDREIINVYPKDFFSQQQLEDCEMHSY